MAWLSPLQKFRLHLREHGLRKTLQRAFGFLHRRLGFGDPLLKRRLQLSRNLYSKFAGVVQHGPLSGLILASDPSWGIGDAAPMILGMYEREVLDLLCSFTDRRTLVDVGAADGYYAIGLVKAKIFRRAVCFEIRERGRISIAAGAAQNGVSGNIAILSAAGPDIAAAIAEQNVELKDVVLLCDVEGAEFEIFTERVLSDLRDAIMIIEIHDRESKDGNEQLSALHSRALKHYQVQFFTSGARNPNSFQELEDFTDSDRWLVCSEGRNYRQQWMLLMPLASRDQPLAITTADAVPAACEMLNL